MSEVSTAAGAETQPPVGGGQRDNFSPVTVHMADTIGAIFLGLISIALFVALLRAEARNRSLAAQLAAGQGQVSE